MLIGDGEARVTQLASIQRGHGEAIAKATENLLEALRQLGPRARMPLMALLVPSLIPLDQAARDAVLAQVDELVQADRKITMGEFALLTLCRRHLAKPIKGAPPVKHKNLDSVLTEVSVVLSVLAHAGRGGMASFTKGIEALGLAGCVMRSPAELGIAHVESALYELKLLAPLKKPAFIKACLAVVIADGKSCADCHGDARESMKGVAVRYPRIETGTGKLVSLETRILQSRVERQKSPAFARESGDLLALNAYITHQSRGIPIEANIEGAARRHFDAGEAFFLRRRGQLNLSCANCHDANWGRTLFAERISQGHPNAYPVYRLEWQTLGSLERRLRACLSGVRAEILPYGSTEYTDLSLYLAWRAKGLPVEAPGVRR